MTAGVGALRVRMLGGLEVEVGGEARELPALHRARSVLAYLALHPGAHPRGALAARFWPDVLDESARASLRTALSAVRRTLGDERLLVATRDAVSLAATWTDVQEFGRLVDAGRCAEALELYRGPLLAGLEDDWVYELRDEFRDRVGEVLAGLAAEAESAGDLAVAIGRTRAWAALDPLDEAPVRELMRRLAAAGDRADALATYERLSERLRTQLGIAPSAATRAAAAAVREGESAPVEWPTGARRAVALPAALFDASATELVGRASELARLRAAWEQARARRPRVVLIAGEPGIGKTRLAAELCRDAHRDHDALVMFGRCDEQPLAPYQPFIEALDRYAQEVGVDELALQVGEERALLARMVPAIQRRVPASATPAADQLDAGRFRLFGAVGRLVREMTDAQPAILVLDDLHWADEPTLLLLQHLLRELRETALLVIGTYRATELETPLTASLAALRRLRCVEEFALGGLNRDEVRALIAVRTGGGYGGDPTAVHRRTEGNPFFVEELIRAQPDEGLPRSVEDLLRRRIQRLDERAARTLQVAAVVGAEFDAALVADVSGLAEDDVIADLEHALAASAVREVSGTPGRFAFAHTLVRETVYSEVSAARRARLHLRVGEALETRLAQDAPGVLAYHFAAAADYPRALGYAIAAARAARRVAAAEAAGEHYDRALQVAARLGRDARTDAEVRELLIERAELRHERSDIEGSALDAKTALAGARATGDRRAELRALTQLGFVVRETDVAAAVPLHEAALALARELGDADAEVVTLNRLSLLHTIRLDMDPSRQAGERALALARKAGDPALLARALDALKLAALWQGDLERLEEMARELLQLVPAQQPWYRGFALLESAFVPIGRRDWPVAEQRLDEAHALAQRAGSTGLAALVGEARSWLRREQGRLAEAIEHARSSLEVVSSLGSQFVGSVSATLATALLAAGDPGMAVGELEHGLAVAARLGAPGEMLRCAGQLALARSLLGDADGAAAAADEAERLLARAALPPGETILICAHGTLGVARVRLAQGDADAARALATPVLGAAERSGWCEFAQSAAQVLAQAGSYPSGQKTS